MGGNVRVMDVNGHEVSATKIDLQVYSRSGIRSYMLELFKFLNQDFASIYGRPIWIDESVLDSGHAFNGSSESFFSDSISDSVFMDIKRVIGDIDITVPSSIKHDVWSYMNSIRGKHTCVGNNRPAYQETLTQINSLFAYQDIFIQVDFEFVAYDDSHRATEFSKFSHSSAWPDMCQALKGVHHKYLLRALTGASSLRTDVQVITRKTGKPQANPGGVTFNKFSVDHGLRVGAYVPVVIDGAHVHVNGLPAYHEVPTSQSKYITDVCEIARHIFGNVSCEDVESHMHSFVGVIELMRKYSSGAHIKGTIARMSDLYWGTGAQGFERDDPEGDHKIKMMGWNALLDAFPQYFQDVTEKKDKYYSNYRLTKQDGT